MSHSFWHLWRHRNKKCTKFRKRNDLFLSTNQFDEKTLEKIGNGNFGIVFKVKLEKNISLGRGDHKVIKTVAVKKSAHVWDTRPSFFTKEALNSRDKWLNLYDSYQMSHELLQFKNSKVSHNDQSTDQEKSAMKNILKFVEEAFVLARLDNQNVAKASKSIRFLSQVTIPYRSQW